MITEQIIDDYHERQFALSINHSFIVQAPAGSGKTELLIQRFLTILAHVNKPESVLAITFTKKAASEMRHRIIQALTEACTQPEPKLAHAKKTWHLAKLVLKRDDEFRWNIINNPNQLKIQTIDSFCAHLSGQLPLLSNLGSSPQIEPHAASLYQSAIRTVLSHLETDYPWASAIETLLIHLDNDIDKLESLITELLGRRDQWLPYLALAEQPEQLKYKLNQDLENLIHDFLSVSKNLFSKHLIDEISNLIEYAVFNLKSSNIESLITQSTGFKNQQTNSIPDLNHWRGIAVFLLTKSHEFRKRLEEKIGFPKLTSFSNKQEIQVHKTWRERYLQLISQLSKREDIRLFLEEVSLLPNNAYSEHQWQILQSLLFILKVSIAQLNIEFQRTGKIDYIENTQAAIRALGTHDQPTDLALVLDYQIQHILIDEFQDTSYTQYQLLERLTAGWDCSDGRTLFVVGDPMQSIYRFREADVGLFLRMQHFGFGQIKLHPIQLTVNFRSSNQIIKWNNKIFNHIFPTYSDIATGAVHFSKSTSHLKSDATNSFIQLTALQKGTAASEASHVIQIIKQTLEQHPSDNIAIIVRSRSHLASIIPQLKLASLKYNAIDIDSLSSKQHVLDLLSLTRALYNLDDVTSWLSILRAPWCGLSLSDLLIISKKDARISILEHLTSKLVMQKLSAEGRVALLCFTEIVTKRILLRDRMPLRTWIENTWLLLGGPAFLNNEYEIQEVNVFFELLEECANDITTFDINSLSKLLAKKYINQQAEHHKINIMTIHAAKGLEFDTVILPQLHRKNPYDDKSLFLWLERPLINNQVITLLAPLENVYHEKDTLYEYIVRQRKLKAQYEVDRLLYVATTRAKKRLYLSFVMNDVKEQTRIEPNSFLFKLWPAVINDTNLLIKNEESSDAKQASHLTKQIKRKTINWVNPYNEQQHLMSQHKKMSGFLIPDYTHRQIGTVIHQLLQTITIKGIKWWINQAHHKSIIKNYLINMNHHASCLQNSAATIQNAINNVLTDKRGIWLLSKHEYDRCEYEVTVLIDNTPVNLVIDRVFVDQTTLWIVDYKSSKPKENQSLTQFLAEEKKQYQDQVARYTNSLKKSWELPVKSALYFPAVPAWIEY